MCMKGPKTKLFIFFFSCVYGKIVREPVRERACAISIGTLILKIKFAILSDPQMIKIHMSGFNLVIF